MNNKVHITETILRDAHQCLIATRLRTEDMLPICAKLDEVGFWALEAWGGATFDACVRFLKEDPWQRLRDLKAALPNTPISMLLRGQNLLGYRHYPDDVVEKFVELAAKNGVDVFRIFDALNDLRNLESSIAAVKKTGKHAQGAISYTTSPVHTVKQFVADAKQLQDMGCDSIAIKDMAGLLKPDACAELVKALVKALKVPVHLHSHATAGLATVCMFKAIENGCRHIDTAISAFAEGASHPCTESIVAGLQDSEFDTNLDLTLLTEVADYFRTVRPKYHQFESAATGLDPRVQIFQVPGGMISNLYNQLKEQGALDKLEQVYAEIPRVRKDLGYPPLVTPSSQIVGTQAVLNVITGERYKTITNEVKLYLQGKYGQPPAAVNKEVRQKAIGNKDVIEGRPADQLSNELDKLRNDIGALAKNEEDLMIFAMFPDIGKEFLEQRESGTLTPELLEPMGVATSVASGQSPQEFNISLHGENYHVHITGAGQSKQTQKPIYLTIDGVPEEVLVQALDVVPEQSETSASDSKRPVAQKPGDVTTSMPGNIVTVLVNEGDSVAAGDPVLVVEAMKMETEIQSPVAGTVKTIYVNKGDTVNPDETLVEIVE